MSGRGSSSSARTAEIGAYRIGGEIGKGSFATVYYGTHKESGAAIAVKSVDLSRLNKKLRQNLSLEIKILRTLIHPHVVALHDCIEGTNKIHLMMEYCELGDLSLFIKKRDKLLTHPATHDMARKYPMPPNGGLNEVVIRHFLKQLASALKFLRLQNLVHRDVKPQNLLLLPSVGYRDSHKPTQRILGASHDSLIPVAGLISLPMLKLGDFGFARVLPSTSLAETLCGSPLYMAPEILRYEKYDAKADLWSIGTVLYEMVSGKPPFRANHHVELLRIIEAAEDQIRFSRSYPVSAELKALIRSLLKQSPVERVSFENFFADPVITGPIPGVVEDDIALPAPKEIKEPAARAVSKSEDPAPSPRRASIRRHATEVGHDDHSTVRPRDVLRRSPPTDTALPVRETGSPRLTKQRPLPITSASAPNKPSLMEGRRQGSSDAAALPPVRELPAGAPRAKPSSGDFRRAHDEREKAAQEVAFERDYVVVDKDQVAVNALADELGRVAIQDPNTAGQMVRRTTAQGLQTVATGAVGSQTREVQIAHGKRPSVHERKASLSSSPGSATSFISKAIQDASLRLLGIKYPPILTKGGGGASPPQFQSPFPTYPINTPPRGFISDGRHGAAAEEDARVAQTIEDYANRGDVVLSFAEVKYKQLVPLAPSMHQNLAGMSSEGVPAAEEKKGLTTEAIVNLSEEALVLFVKSLSMLAKSMEIAGLWWTRKSRNEPPTTGTPLGSGAYDPVMSARINSAVQWVRARFNEVLEKVEVVRLKLLEAQKKLPEDHPSHPNNNRTESSTTSGGIHEDIVLTTGISAEKLMYDRAVEMSRAAAIQEISNDDLADCDLSYVTSIRMLEAVLDGHEDMSRRRSSGSKRDESVKAPEDVGSQMDLDDQQAVRKLIDLIGARRAFIRNKTKMIAEAARQSSRQQHIVDRRRSGTASPRSLPSSS